MRIKVASVPPLPSIHVWYSLPESTPASSSRAQEKLITIQSLKQRLCADLGALHDARIHAEDILLLMDDFELLDSSGVDVLRDGDLIWCGTTCFYCSLISN